MVMPAATQMTVLNANCMKADVSFSSRWKVRSRQHRNTGKTRPVWILNTLFDHQLLDNSEFYRDGWQLSTLMSSCRHVASRFPGRLRRKLPASLVRTALDGALGSPVPMALLATTRNSYSTQGLSCTAMADSMSPVTGSGSAHTSRVMVGTEGVAFTHWRLLKKPREVETNRL